MSTTSGVPQVATPSTWETSPSSARASRARAREPRSRLRTKNAPAPVRGTAPFGARTASAASSRFALDATTSTPSSARPNAMPSGDSSRSAPMPPHASALVAKHAFDRVGDARFRKRPARDDGPVARLRAEDDERFAEIAPDLEAALARQASPARAIAGIELGRRRLVEQREQEAPRRLEKRHLLDVPAYGERRVAPARAAPRCARRRCSDGEWRFRRAQPTASSPTNTAMTSGNEREPGRSRRATRSVRRVSASGVCVSLNAAPLRPDRRARRARARRAQRRLRLVPRSTCGARDSRSGRLPPRAPRALP